MSWIPEVPAVTESETALETAPRTAVSAEPPAGGPTRTRLRARPRRGPSAGWPVLRAVAVGDRDGVWSQPPTPVSSVVRYADEGEWTTPDGDLRGLARLYAALVGVSASAALYLAAWVIQRPIRGRGAGRPRLGATPPPALADLLIDAIRGSWCPPAATVRLAAGRAYAVLVVLPVSAALYLAAAVVQRPGRLIALVLLLLVIRFF